jgi:hypothetical protein
MTTAERLELIRAHATHVTKTYRAPGVAVAKGAPKTTKSKVKARDFGNSRVSCGNIGPMISWEPKYATRLEVTAEPAEKGFRHEAHHLTRIAERLKRDWQK